MIPDNKNYRVTKTSVTVASCKRATTQIMAHILQAGSAYNGLRASGAYPSSIDREVPTALESRLPQAPRHSVYFRTCITQQLDFMRSRPAVKQRIMTLLSLHHDCNQMHDHLLGVVVEPLQAASQSYGLKSCAVHYIHQTLGRRLSQHLQYFRLIVSSNYQESA